MKFSSIAAIFSFASIAVAVDLSGIPQCALVCFAQGSAAAGCNVNDLICQCTTGKDALTKAVTPCVQNTCNSADQAKTAAAAVQICQEALASGSASAGPSATGSSNSTASKTGTTATSTGGASIRQAGAIGAGVGVLAAILL